MVSEETAIHQYLYQHLILKEPYNDILEKIAIVEMNHSNLLAETIFLLGKDPKYEVESTEMLAIPWTSSYVPYPKSLEEMMKVNIEAEKTAIRNYSNQILAIDDKYIKEMLYRIIEDEKLHLKVFNQILSENTK